MKRFSVVWSEIRQQQTDGRDGAVCIFKQLESRSRVRSVDPFRLSLRQGGLGGVMNHGHVEHVNR